MADPVDPLQIGAQTPSQNSKSFSLKRLDEGPFRSTTLSHHQAAWKDALEFLRSIRKNLFDPEAAVLNEAASQRLLFVPQLISPTSKAAGDIELGLEIESAFGLRNQFVFIEDIYYFVYQ